MPATQTFVLSEAGEPFAEYDATSATDALAQYSIDEGFADPRVYIGTEEDFFYTLPDGTVGMVFTNTEITAKEQ